jgi:hypothetical protein
MQVAPNDYTRKDTEMTTQTAVYTTTSRDLIDTYKRRTSGHFFDADTMRFFKSRVSSTVYTLDNGYVFVTSERDEAHYWSYSAGQYINHDSGRKYTVRYWNGTDDSSIDTIGELMQYETSRQAHKAAQEYVKAHTA